MRTIMYRAFLGCALFASLLSTVSCANRTDISQSASARASHRRAGVALKGGVGPS